MPASEAYSRLTGSPRAWASAPWRVPAASAPVRTRRRWRRSGRRRRRPGYGCIRRAGPSRRPRRRRRPSHRRRPWCGRNAPTRSRRSAGSQRPCPGSTLSSRPAQPRSPLVCPLCGSGHARPCSRGRSPTASPAIWARSAAEAGVGHPLPSGTAMTLTNVEPKFASMAPGHATSRSNLSSANPCEPPLARLAALVQCPATRGFVVGIPRWHARSQGFKSPQLHQAQCIGRAPTEAWISLARPVDAVPQVLRRSANLTCAMVAIWD